MARSGLSDLITEDASDDGLPTSSGHDDLPGWLVLPPEGAGLLLLGEGGVTPRVGAGEGEGEGDGEGEACLMRGSCRGSGERRFWKLGEGKGLKLVAGKPSKEAAWKDGASGAGGLAGTMANACLEILRAVRVGEGRKSTARWAKAV